MLFSRKIRTNDADQSQQSQSLQPLQLLQPPSLLLTFKKGSSVTLENGQGVEQNATANPQNGSARCIKVKLQAETSCCRERLRNVSPRSTCRF